MLLMLHHHGKLGVRFRAATPYPAIVALSIPAALVVYTCMYSELCYNRSFVIVNDAEPISLAIPILPPNGVGRL